MADQDLARIAKALEALNDRMAEMHYRICLLEGRPATPPRPKTRYPETPVKPIATPFVGYEGRPQTTDAQAASQAQLVTELPPPAAVPQEEQFPPELVNAIVEDIISSGPTPAFIPGEVRNDPIASNAAPRTEKRIADFISRHAAPTSTDAPRGGTPPTGQKLGLTLEQALGKNWAAWLGGLIVVLGMLYFLKLVWDQDWFYLSPPARVIAAMGVGAIFTAFGEALHFRKMSVLAGTLHGVGLAIVMASFFAGYTAFQPPVMSRSAALLGVLLTGIAGVGLSLHIRQITLAIIALLGMYLAPAVLRSGEGSSLAFLTYLAVITATGCTVSIGKPNWQLVRWVTLAGTWLWTSLWVTDAHGTIARAHFNLALIFPTAFLVMFLVEMIAGSYRAVRNPDAAASKAELSRCAISLFVNTSLAIVVIWAAFPKEHQDILYRVPLGLAGIMFLVWVVTPARIIKTTAVILATNLITLAVPMYFSANTATFAWAILSLSLGLFASVINSRIVHWWAFSLVGLVLARLFTVDAANPIYQDVAYHFLRKDISWWAIMAWGAAIYAFVMSIFLKISLSRLAPKVSTDLWTEDPLDALLSRSAAWTRFAAPAIFVGVGFYLINNGSEIALLHALLLGIFAYFTRDVVARFGAMVLLVGACITIFGLEQSNPILGRVMLKIAGEPVKLWLALPIAAALIAHVLAILARLRLGKESASYSLVASTLGTAIFVLGAIACFSDGATIMLIHAAILIVCTLMSRNMLLPYFTIALLFVCMARIVFGVHMEPLRQQAIAFLILCHLAAIFIAARIKPGDKPESIWPAWAAGALGTLGFLIIGTRLFDAFSELTLVGIVVALVLQVLARLLPGLGYQLQSSLLTVLLLIKWIAVDSAGTVLAADPYSLSPVLHLFTLNGVLISALVLMMPVPDELSKTAANAIRFWILVAMTFAWLNVETLAAIDALMGSATAWIGSAMVVKNTSISVLWGLVGFGFVLWGMFRRLPAHRWVGLWVLGFTVAKILLVDLANVETVLRIVSFIAVGILLLGVSFVYHRQSQKNGRNGHSQGDEFSGTNGTNPPAPKPANMV